MHFDSVESLPPIHTVHYTFTIRQSKLSFVKLYFYIIASINESKQWCMMMPCPIDEECSEFHDEDKNITGWQCRNGDIIKTTIVSLL